MLLSQYQQIQLISTATTELDYLSKICDVLKIDKTKYTFKDLNDKVEKLLKSKESKVRKYYWIGKRLFKCQHDLKKVRFEFYVEYEHFIANINTEAEIIKNIHYFVALFLQPVGFKFGLNTIDKIAQYIKKYAKLEDVMSLNNFFFLLEQNSMNNTKIYLINQALIESYRTSTEEESNI